MNDASSSSLLNASAVARRTALKTGLAATALGMTKFAVPSWAFIPELDDEVVVSFIDMPKTPANRLNWEQLKSWLTPTDQAFNVQHYGLPEVDIPNFKLEIAGLVKKPISLSMRVLLGIQTYPYTN